MFLDSFSPFKSNPQQYPMKLVLEAIAVELDSAGQIKARLYDCQDMALKLNGIDIDGVFFSMKDTGTSMEIKMEGKNLSAEIKPNYPAPPRSPVMQIGFKEPDAKFTANTLNKLLRMANKLFPGKVLLIRDVKRLVYSD
jgi:hypothetical protein